jgi:D-glycero-alpha-D-manno-heptose-7-phosphate kinase
MIVSKTPFRISFFGGGSDYPAWYLENGGAVISTTIDKYCFISCRPLPKFFDHNHRIVYSIIESVKNINEIQHPSVREVLNWKRIKTGLEIHHDGDLPARSGLGSSSAFTVGLLNALEALEGKIISKKDLAKNAIHIEQNIINENVGSQDQVATSYGGLNKIKFNNDNSFNVEKIIIHPQRYKELDDNLLLFFTGTTRFASTIAEEQIKNIKNTSNQINEMVEMVDHSISILRNNDSIDEFGKLLNKSWVLKKTLSTKISNNLIDNIYETALSNGALGGKLLGAGGGGFILFYVPKKKQKAVRQALDKLNNVPFNFDNQGSSIVLYEPNGL